MKFISKSIITLLATAMLMSTFTVTKSHAISKSGTINVSFEQVDGLEVILTNSTVDFGVVGASESIQTNEVEIEVISSANYDVKIKSNSEFFKIGDPITGTDSTITINKLSVSYDSPAFATYNELSTSELEIGNGIQTLGRQHYAKFKLAPLTGYPIGNYKASLTVLVTQP